MGVDYYGRAVVSIAVGGCKEFDPEYRHNAIATPGRITDDGELIRLRTNGLFGPETAFRRRVILEELSEVSGVPDGEPFTIAVATVRPMDTAES